MTIVTDIISRIHAARHARHVAADALERAEDGDGYRDAERGYTAACVAERGAVHS